MSKDRFTASRYHTMSASEKRAEAIASVREQPVACPRCDTQLMPADVEIHLEQRCTGPREPGPGSKWVTWQEAKRLVPARTLTRWIDRGRIRFKGGRGDRLYLHRDLVKHRVLTTVNRRR